MSAFEHRLYTAAKVHSSDITSLPLHVIVALFDAVKVQSSKQCPEMRLKNSVRMKFSHFVNVGKTEIEKYQGKLYVHMKVWSGMRKMNLQCRKNPEL